MRIYLLLLGFSAIILYVASQYDIPYINVKGNCVHSKISKQLFVVFSIALILVAGLRYYVGTDYGGYYRFAYSAWAESPLQHLINFDEPGIYFINSILARFTNDGAVSIFVLSFITLLFGLYSIYRNSKYLFFSGILFIFCSWDGGFNAVRQGLASAILIAGIGFMKNRKFWRYLLIVLIATLFHKSAIVMLFPYFAVSRKITLRNIFLLSTISIVVLLSYDKLFSVLNLIMDKQYDTSNVYIARQINPLRLAVAVTPFLVYFTLMWGRIETYKDNFYLNLLLIHAVCTIMAFQSAMIARVGIYTGAYIPFAFPELNNSLKNRNNRIILPMAEILLYGIYWIYGLRTGNLTPFQWIWQR